MASKQPPRVRLNKGGGPPPGYRWHVATRSEAVADAAKFLDDLQQAFVRARIKELAMEPRPSHPEWLSDVRAIGEMWELREKGGPLGKKNLRVFFWIDHQCALILILGMFNKAAEGATPEWIKGTMADRLAQYLAAQLPRDRR